MSADMGVPFLWVGWLGFAEAEIEIGVLGLGRVVRFEGGKGVGREAIGECVSEGCRLQRGKLGILG